MAKQTITIDSILSGHQPTEYFGQKDQYQSAIGIDPDMPKDDSSVKTSGLIRPTAMAKFSASEVTGVPLWIESNPKTNNSYVYANDGKVHTVASGLTMGTALNSGTALSSASGNGSAYYDNYMYFAKNTDICSYGPLNGTPALDQDYWTTVAGGGLTALTDTTYPSINGVEIPNHPMHRHSDDKLYFGDVNSDNKGIISYVKTTKTTVEGDTDNGSSYNSLDFDYGYYPTAIATYNTLLAVALIEGTDTTIKQKPAAIIFWDTTSDSFNQIIQVEFPDPIITAIKNVNGRLYVWSGNASGGYRVSVFAGGYTFQEVYYSEEGYPPFQGAVDAEMNRVVWGSSTTDPAVSGCVMALGSKKAGLSNGVHNILKSTSAGANPHVTALKYLTQASNKINQPVIGFDDDSAKGLDKISTTYGTNVFRSGMFRVGKPFQITKIWMPMTQAVAANMTITPKIYVDDASSNSTLTVINSTNYSNSERNVAIYPDVNGQHNFFLELTWSGTALLTVGLPIIIEFETLETDNL